MLKMVKMLAVLLAVSAFAVTANGVTYVWDGDGGTSNNWHSGPCANAGRARRHRERREADVAART